MVSFGGSSGDQHGLEFDFPDTPPWWLRRDQQQVKVKSADEETTKRQMPRHASAHGGIDPEARRFLDEALEELAGEPAPNGSPRA